MCGVSVAWYKLVAEKGDWQHPYLHDADRAYLRGGGEEDKALLGWWISAEMGYEGGQNNVAYALSRARANKAGQGHPLPDWARDLGKDTELGLWIRSAAQDNVDAMVKVGDHYCECR